MQEITAETLQGAVILQNSSAWVEEEYCLSAVRAVYYKVREETATKSGFLNVFALAEANQKTYNQEEGAKFDREDQAFRRPGDDAADDLCQSKGEAGRGAICGKKGEEIIGNLDYDFSLAEGDIVMRSSVIARTIVLDRLVKSWRAAHFGAVVVNLPAGWKPGASIYRAMRIRMISICPRRLP